MPLTWNDKGDEKIPLAPEKSASNMGAILKSSHVTSPPSAEKKKKEEEGEAEPSEKDLGPMSVGRKFVMFLSVNCGIFYIAFFAVLLPCRQEFHQHLNTSNHRNSSVNLNTSVVDKYFSAAVELLGYPNGNETSNGIVCEFENSAWRIELDFTAIGCHCKVMDADGDSYVDCNLTGKSQKAVFKTWKEDEFREGAIYNTLDLDPSGGLIISDCVWEEMCLVILGKRRVGSVAVTVKKDNTEMLIETLYFPCGEYVEDKTTWAAETTVPQFAFNCSYS